MPFELGLIAALISAIGWGSYFVPMKKKGDVDIFSFQLVMCAGIFLSSIVFSLLMQKFSFVPFAFISGIVWGFGNLLSAFAVKRIGLSIAPPVWMGTGIFASFLLGILAAGESVSLIIGLAGIAVLALGFFALSGIYGKGNSDFKGILFSLLAGIVFGSYLLPLSLFGFDPQDYFFPMSLGILVSGVSIFAFSRKKLESKIIPSGMASGFVWNIANFSSLFAVSFLGLAIGFPLTQLALFVSVMWGLFYFREFKEKSKIKRIIIAGIIIFLGAIILSFAKI